MATFRTAMLSKVTAVNALMVNTSLSQDKPNAQLVRPAKWGRGASVVGQTAQANVWSAMTGAGKTGTMNGTRAVHCAQLATMVMPTIPTPGTITAATALLASTVWNLAR
jgi:hypothetical protein